MAQRSLLNYTLFKFVVYSLVARGLTSREDKVVDGLRAGQGQGRSDRGGEALKRNSDVDLSAQKNFYMGNKNKMNTVKMKSPAEIVWFI